MDETCGVKDPVLEVKKSRVLEAAKGCRDTDRVLRKLFPEAFVPAEVPVKVELEVIGSDSVRIRGRDKRGHRRDMGIDTRCGGKYSGKGIWLGYDDEGEWKVVKDDENQWVLLPPWVDVVSFTVRTDE